MAIDFNRAISMGVFILLGLAGLAHAQGASGRMGGGGTERPTANRPAPSVDPAPGSTADLDRRIAALERALAASQPERPADLRTAEVRAIELADRIRGMRGSLRVPPPSPETPLGRNFDRFRERWSVFAAPIALGRIPAARVPPDRWTAITERFSTLYCANMGASPAEGLRPVGMAWACLSDAFFHEMARLEQPAAAYVGDRTHRAFIEIDRAMAEVDRTIGTARALDAVPSLLLMKLSSQLHAAGQAANRLDLAELQAVRRAVAADSSFDWFVTIRRSLKDTAAKHGRLSVSVGPAFARVSVGESSLARLARALHDCHLAIVSNPENQQLLTDRARLVSAMAEAAK